MDPLAGINHGQLAIAYLSAGRNRSFPTVLPEAEVAR